VEKNPTKRTHPCLVPFDQLSPEQKAKDAVFCAIVDTIVYLWV
jgi:hypothetical protein